MNGGRQRRSERLAQARAGRDVGKRGLRPGVVRVVPRARRRRATSARRSRRARRSRIRRRSGSCSGTARARCRRSERVGRRADERDGRVPQHALRRPGWRLTPRPVVRPSWYEGRFARWLVTTDHKRIGLLYIVDEPGLLRRRRHPRAADARASSRRRTSTSSRSDSYNELFTIHGTTMVFLVVVPILAGFGNFLVPLMIGARDMAFPRLNALSYWLFLLGGVVLCSELPRRRAARPSAAGRATRRSRSAVLARARQSTSGSSSLHLLTIASLAGAINFIATIHNMRAAGMTWMRHPALRLGDRGLLGAARARAAGARGRAHAAPARPPRRHALLRTRPRAAAPSSGSTSSGSSGTPRSTS